MESVSGNFLLNFFQLRRIIFLLFVWYILLCDVLAVHGQTQREFTPEEKVILKASKAQAKRSITYTDKALRIGDKVPDIMMEKVFNYPGGKARLSDFKGKSILLDFWARTCGSCIGAFPKMEQLQRKYSDRIQILAVCTYNTWEALNVSEPGFPARSTSAGIRNATLPLVFNSEEMVDFFPHTFEPYLVWIDSEGIIRAMIDGGNSVNEEVIDKMLNGDYTSYPLSLSFRRVAERAKFAAYDPTHPFMTEGGGRLVDKIIYMKRSQRNPRDYVALAKLSNTYGNAHEAVIDTATGVKKGIRMLYFGLISLFRFAYPVDQQFVIVESPTPEKYYGPSSSESKEDWSRDHTYSFEVFGSTEEYRRVLLREALADYFKGISPNFEQRKVRCLVLRRTSKADKLKTHYLGEPSRTESSGRLFALRNCVYGYFIGTLQFYNSIIHKNKTLPILDETGFSQEHRIDLDLQDIGNIEGLKAQLRQYDLSLSEEERWVEMLVLKELPNR